MRRDRRGGLIAAVVIAGLLLLVAATPARAVDRTVRPGGLLQVNAGGFAPHAAVTVRVLSRPGSTGVEANSHGRIRLAYRAPTAAGTYVLVAYGPPPARLAPLAGPSQVEVLVPRVVRVVFRVLRPAGPSAGVGGVAQHSPDPSAGVGGESAGHAPAGTGVDVELLVLIGGVLVAVGLLVLAFLSRRSGHAAPTRHEVG